MTSKSRERIIAGNWKMNHGIKETEDYFKKLKLNSSHTVVIFPPYISLEKAIECTKSTEIEIGAQNGHGSVKGAFTGEVSGTLLKEVGVNWVLLGHSERRQLFGETNAGVKARAEGLLAQGFHLMICIGENKAEREGGKTNAVLEKQIRESLSADIINSGNVCLAYEPVWAIGTGLNATPVQADEAHQMISSHLKKYFGSGDISILYGGSVTPENSKELLSCSNVDGLLVGGASLDPLKFAAIVS